MNYQMTARKFHGIVDNETVVFDPSRLVERKESKYFIVQEREVSYRFYLHQHPYVQQLVRRLLRKSTSGLQAADTEYHTRISLTTSTLAEGSNGRSVQLAKGETLYLSDGATVTLDGTVIRFTGSKVVKLSDDSPLTPAADREVTVDAKTTLGRRNGDMVTLNANVAAVIIDGVPVPKLYSDFFSEVYNPNLDLVPNKDESPHPVKDLDFTSSGAYSVYNWELFYHVPITFAIHLSKNHRFAEAQRWLHFLFDPTDDSEGPTPERFWKVRPFQHTDVKKIEEILVNLVTGADEALRNETIHSIEAWKDAPFRPHVIARYRQQAYMYKTVMAYLDNLIAWGDSLFRQDTGEATDEALQLYVLAANILGPRPQPVPNKGSVRPQTYANLRQDLSQFGTVMRNMEPDLPFDLMPFPTNNKGDDDRLAMLRSLGKALYFCVPRNDKLLSYWDTVADRLFKIRNSLNIKGVFRQLALFEPPIDPAMLARAVAAGLDVSAIVNGLNQPLPLVRFQLLVQKAAEIVQEVKSLGNNLLSAMEKEDGEALSILRAKHERVVMEMVEHVKYGQLQEAIKSKEGLLQSLALAIQRYTYYEQQLGKNADKIKKTIPELEDLDKDSLDKMKLDMQEPVMALHEIEVDIAENPEESGGKKVSSYEDLETAKLKDAKADRETASDIHKAGAVLAYIPDLKINIEPMGAGSTIDFGGSFLSNAERFFASFWEADADKFTYEANRANRIDSFARREQDWTFQSNLAAGEINQIFKQLRAAEIREGIADKELKNHRQQIKHAQEIEYFLAGEKNPDWSQKIDSKEKKTTNRALYSWMKREVKGLYGRCFQFAFDIAKKAERALQHELGNTELSYLQFGYLAGKEGLLAGEKLHLDVKRMEMAYHEANQREYELTKHISLLQVDPMALIQLRTTGRCTVRLPESLFDIDGPGHYFRRIKTVAMSIPCVTGPYTSVNCTLTLLKSSIRKTQILLNGVYAREDAEDDRFSDNFGSLQSIVTSSAQNDSGLFETNLRDERYLPFENSGVISEWQLQLPMDPSKNDPVQFDYETISDVILHIRYTAREGGGLLRNGAITHVNELITEAKVAGSVRLFSVRHEFPNAWAKFRNQAPSESHRFKLVLNLRKEHYPYWSQGRPGAIRWVEAFARPIDDLDIQVAFEIEGNFEPLADKLGNLQTSRLSRQPDSPTGEFTLYFNTSDIEELWFVLAWDSDS